MEAMPKDLMALNTHTITIYSPQENGIGNSVYLTIDSILQKSIEQIVKKTQQESKSSYIDTILMDATTGEILSFVSIPSFDSNT